MNASGTLDPLAAARGRPRGRTRELAAARHEDDHAARARGQRRRRAWPRSRAGMLNSIGLAEPGARRRSRAALPERARARPPARRLDRRLRSRRLRAACRARSTASPGIAALELNVSCPNVETGCISIGTDPAETEAVVRALPRAPRPAAVGQALAERRRRRRDRARGRARRAPTRLCSRTRCAAGDRPLDAAAAARRRHAAGSPGPALKPVALAAVWTCRAGLRAPDRRRRRHRERAGRARLPGRRAQARCRSGPPRSASRCSPGASATSSRRLLEERGRCGAVSALKTTTLD